MTNQKVNYATAGLLLVAALAMFTPRVQAEEQRLDNTQIGTEAPEATSLESPTPGQPTENRMQHDMPHDMPSMKSGNMQHDMPHDMPDMKSGNMQHDTGNMQHDMPGTDSTTPPSPSGQSPAN